MGSRISLTPAFLKGEITMKRDEVAMSECYQCKHKRNVAGNAHIGCANPDPEMTGSEHGIKNGWFFYPFLFDPVWKEKRCKNFDPQQVNRAISDAVSRETHGQDAQC